MGELFSERFHRLFTFESIAKSASLAQRISGRPSESKPRAIVLWRVVLMASLLFSLLGEKYLNDQPLTNQPLVQLNLILAEMGTFYKGK